jgi:hypothetical protein
MFFNFEQIPSDSPFVEAIWRNRPERGGSFISMAVSHWGLVVTRHNGKISVTIRGPESKASVAYCPPDAEHFGVYFKLGTFMPFLPAGRLRDGAITLPDSSSDSFWMNGASWRIPEFEDLEIFINRLVRGGLLVYDPAIDVVLQGGRTDFSVRSMQRKFLRALGLTHGGINQINRARYATILLMQGVSILDTVSLAGYADQPHLTRSLKYYIGQTPAQLIRERESTQLSFLFQTT